MSAQRTLQNGISATGVGVHSGEVVFMEIRPAAQPDTGIIFRRVDRTPVVDIPARTENVTDTMLCTALGVSGASVATVEHLMSAFAGLGIDNAYVDISAPELPIMDGSSAPFVFLIQSAGVALQNKPKKFIRIKKSITVKGDNGSFVKLTPYDGFRVNFQLEYTHPAICKNKQSLTLDLSDTSYVRELSRARTYGFVSDFETLRARNLALGASLDNTVAMDEYSILNKDGLRYDDEMVRHKILDVIGDLYLLGHSVIGEFTGFKSGHALNNLLLHRLLENQDAWEFVSYEDSEKAPIKFFLPSFAGL
jgi:UDP-3-O-[3-hydroxymyristoyl] N-acetylglucosamine deacetylase